MSLLWDGFAVHNALERLGIDRLVLCIHQGSFPAGDCDLGFGTPYSPTGRAFLEFVAKLGFSGVALGPAGVTSLVNNSPYDSTTFSLNPMFVDPEGLDDLVAAYFARVDPGSSAPSTKDVDPLREASRTCASGGSSEAAEADLEVGRVVYRRAYGAARRSIASACARLSGHATVKAAVDADLAAFEAEHPWLRRESGYEGMAACFGEEWSSWPNAPLLTSRARDAERAFLFGQMILDGQHRRMRSAANAAGLRLYADAQIGVSHRDRALYRDLFLTDYRMGAPPSRTNPEGQPWGYPVLDPAQLVPGGRAEVFVRARVERLLALHDGLRIDHPHGWVCPWVYSADAALDPRWAVQHGARLHESPDLEDHRGLARYAYVRPDQIDRALARHDDRWVRDLEAEQLARYARSIDRLLVSADAHGIPRADLLVEVLSTCPTPLREVLAARGLGRFRVTQKAKVDDPLDVYRSDNAKPEDWIMVGNHDTPSLRQVVAGFSDDEWARRRAWLVTRLDLERRRGPEDSSPPAAPRDPVGLSSARVLIRADGPTRLAEAMLAELFLGPARNVQIFWPDLFGVLEPYNRPGIVDPRNWTLRVPFDFDGALRAAVEAGRAPHVGRALGLALRARGGSENLALAHRLEA